VNSMQSSQNDFEIEQKDIVNLVKSKERKGEGEGGASKWSRFDADLACRVVKQFLKKHLPQELKVVGPNVYIDGYPTEFDLLLVTHTAIPAAFTNAYRDQEVRLVIEVESHGKMDREFSSELIKKFENLRYSYRNIRCAYLTIRDKGSDENTSTELKKLLEPYHPVFCLAESTTYELIPGQWREFVNHVATVSKL